MLTHAQEVAIFQNIATAYTVDGHAYTAWKTYRGEWSGVLDTPIISLQYPTRTKKVVQAIGVAAEWDTDTLTVDVYARTDTTNGVHGAKIVEEIVRVLELWFKQTAKNALVDDGVSVRSVSPVKDLSALEEGVFRLRFEVSLLYALI